MRVLSRCPVLSVERAKRSATNPQHTDLRMGAASTYSSAHPALMCSVERGQMLPLCPMVDVTSTRALTPKLEPNRPILWTVGANERR